MKQIKMGSLLLPMFAFVVGVTTATVLIANSLRPTTPPPQPPDPPQHYTSNKAVLELVFVLDTTGSMGGLIEGAKQKIWSIVNEVMQSTSKPAVRVGLVAYRDRGDEFVTRVSPLTNDLDQIYSTLMSYRAGGGGDTPENVRRALAEGVREAGWSQSAGNIAQILFLVGDAPPHDDYQDEPSTETSIGEASRAGIIINTIQCGSSQATTSVWQAIANGGQGQYFAIAQDGGVQAISTPYDKDIAEMGAKLGATFVGYGGGAGPEGARVRGLLNQRQARAEEAVAASAPASAAADRAMNKVLNSEAYVGDLLQSVENGTVKLDSIKEEDLPEDLRRLATPERNREIERRLVVRKQLRADIMSLSKQRDEFISNEHKKKAGSSKQAGFDAAVAKALKDQMAKKGIK